MIQKKLFQGNGVSLTPVYTVGRRESAYVRLIAEENMAITDGVTVSTCADVRISDTERWADCDPAEQEELTDREALAIILGGDL